MNFKKFYIISTVILCILPMIFLFLYVVRILIPGYERTITNYHIVETQKNLEKIIGKNLEDLKITARDYSVWSNMYEAFQIKDIEYIKRNYSGYLPDEPYNLSLILAVDLNKNPLDFYSDQPYSVDSLLQNKEIDILYKKTLEDLKNGGLNAAIKSGYIKLNNYIYAFGISPILDDRDFSKPPMGILLIGREINENFLGKVNSYIESPLIFCNEDKEHPPLIKGFLKREIPVFDIWGHPLGRFISYFNLGVLRTIYRNFFLFFIIFCIFIFSLGVLFAISFSSYFARQFYDLEVNALKSLSINNSERISGIIAQNIKNPFKKVSMVVDILSRELKEKIAVLEAQRKRLLTLYESEKRQFEDTIKMLVSIVELKDPYTKGHAERVSKIAVKIGEKLGISPSERENLEIAGLLHDIGKIIIPENILNKTGKLSRDEYELIKLHTTYGFHILNENQTFRHIAKIVLFHHENINGTGYPRGIKGEDIPLESKIISIADVYDALTTDRPYRKAYSKEEALKIMEQDAGKKFDEKIFEVFKEVIREGDIHS
ncbi:HD domain-containing phosphohydrolase [Thermovenabulum sp.]|uniref:HD domain-containing phosphohydrolase n=1 Tax=Thermovenabulum sp. TaxID=3100335 RepID=UPI003C7BD79A